MTQVSDVLFIDRRQVDIPGDEQRPEIITTVSRTAPAASTFAYNEMIIFTPTPVLHKKQDSDWTALASEEAIGRIWNDPEEDEAWRDL